MDTPKTLDISDPYQRYLFCTAYLEKAIQELGSLGILAGDIMDTMTHIVVSSCVMNEVDKDSFIAFIGALFNRASEASHQSELIMQDDDSPKS